jgi:DNA anti-recombination protein RmuC
MEHENGEGQPVITCERRRADVRSRVPVCGNAPEIAEAVQELFTRVAKFTEHFEKIYTGLERANSAYNDAVGSYERMFRPSGEKLQKLGGGTNGKELAAIAPMDATLRLPSV